MNTETCWECGNPGYPDMMVKDGSGNWVHRYCERKEVRTVGLSPEDQLDRKLTYQFFTLSFPARLRVVIDLGLVFNGDEGLLSDRAELWKAWLARAKERGALPLLSWHLARATVFDKIEKALWLCPDGGEALTEMLKTIQESREYKEWKPEKLERL